MALNKFSKSKTFHVDYCGCTAATSLTNESAIRDAINFVRHAKSKRDFIKTSITVSKDGVKITYENERKYSTHVPALMIASSACGRSAFNDTVGVVYISPLTGEHYPAFVHVYRCDSARAAHKLVSRFRQYDYNENHRSHIHQLEQKFQDNNLLNSDCYDTQKLQSQTLVTATSTSNKTNTNTNISSTSTSSSSRLEKPDPVKSITEELKRKIDSNEPILFPPKDYDTIHASHGNIQRANAWKSTEPTIVGYSSINPDSSPTRQQQTQQQQQQQQISSQPQRAKYHSPNHNSTPDKYKKTESTNGVADKHNRQRYSTLRSDTTVDPVEAVSLAFDFLKDETGSLLTDTEGNVDNFDTEQQEKPGGFRFRPAPISAITKKFFTRTQNYELSNNVSPPTSLQNDLSSYYEKLYNRHQTTLYENRARSEANLHHDSQPGLHLSPRYESRLVNGSGAPIPTNPLWSGAPPIMVGSQPNLLSYDNTDIQRSHHKRSSPQYERRLTSAPLQHPLYAGGYPNNNRAYLLSQAQQKRPPPPPPPPIQRRPATPSQYLDTNEFILRPSSGNSSNISHYGKQPLSNLAQDQRQNPINVNNRSTNAFLDVYY